MTSHVRPIVRTSLLLVCLPFLIMACGDPGGDGTAVGNPGLVSMAVASVHDVEIRDAVIVADSITLEGCDGTSTETVEIEGGGLGYDGGLEVPSGTWCWVWIPDSLLVVDGILASVVDDDDDELDGEFYAELTLEAIQLSGPTTAGFEVAEDAELVLELGSPGWTSAEELGLEEDNFVVVEGEDELHDELAERVAEGTALFDDVDGDGWVDEAERSSGLIASTEEPDPVDEGPGDSTLPICALGGTAGAPPAGLLLLFGLALARRRR